jgi:hypothetical protein
MLRKKTTTLYFGGLSQFFLEVTEEYYKRLKSIYFVAVSILSRYLTSMRLKSYSLHHEILHCSFRGTGKNGFTSQEEPDMKPEMHKKQVFSH